MGTRITAIICTFNRAGYLRTALRSLVDQTLPPDQYEIIVVDNGSHDDTRRVVREEYKHVANLRYLYDPIPEANRARNIGWRNAAGDYLAYLDDDVIACGELLENTLKIFDTVEPKPGCVGGRVEPIWERPRPSWLSDKIVNYLAVVDHADGPRALGADQWLVSANIAFPRNLLAAVGGFPEYLGRKGNNLLSMDENLLQDTLRNKGYTLYYDPDVAVRHHIQAVRLTKRWFIRRMYWEGISVATALIHQDAPPAARRLRLAAYAVRKRLLSPRKVARLLRPTDDPDRFAAQCAAWIDAGYVAGLLCVAK